MKHKHAEKRQQCRQTKPARQLKVRAAAAPAVESPVLPFRVGHGWDLHRLKPGYPLIVGGVDIPHDRGCVAHSDGKPQCKSQLRNTSRAVPTVLCPSAPSCHCPNCVCRMQACVSPWQKISYPAPYSLVFLDLLFNLRAGAPSRYRHRDAMALLYFTDHFDRCTCPCVVQVPSRCSCATLAVFRRRAAAHCCGCHFGSSVPPGHRPAVPRQRPQVERSEERHFPERGGA